VYRARQTNFLRSGRVKKEMHLRLAPLFALVCFQPVFAQPAATPLPKLPDDAVLAEFDDGVKFTVADFKRYYATLPPAQQQAALLDRAAFLQQYGVMRKLAQMAEKEKIAEQSPYKEAIENYRMQTLSQAMVQEQFSRITVQPEEIAKFYEKNKVKYSQVKVKALYIAFADGESDGGKKALTDQQAEAKAKKLLADARGGADFVKLIKENSDDETSRAKDGDFDTLRQTDNIPDAFRAAVFQLKKGEITEPLKQPNGYYLLRAEEVSYRPLSDVRDDIYGELQNAKANDWLDKINISTVVKVVNEAFVGNKAK
jgi:parvulin-like peptidyl-prolyl isomerase